MTINVDEMLKQEMRNLRPKRMRTCIYCGQPVSFRNKARTGRDEKIADYFKPSSISRGFRSRASRSIFPRKATVLPRHPVYVVEFGSGLSVCESHSRVTRMNVTARVYIDVATRLSTREKGEKGNSDASVRVTRWNVGSVGHRRGF